jgi:hypothetical protein
MRYVEARLDKFKREETYRIFVTESLRLAPHGKFTKTYRELLKPQEIDRRSGDQIVADVMKNAGLTFGG